MKAPGGAAGTANDAKIQIRPLARAHRRGGACEFFTTIGQERTFTRIREEETCHRVRNSLHVSGLELLRNRVEPTPLRPHVALEVASCVDPVLVPKPAAV
jgi:hypothetical protein